MPRPPSKGLGRPEVAEVIWVSPPVSVADAGELAVADAASWLEEAGALELAATDAAVDVALPLEEEVVEPMSSN